MSETGYSIKNKLRFLFYDHLQYVLLRMSAVVRNLELRFSRINKPTISNKRITGGGLPKINNLTVSNKKHTGEKISEK